jgi:cytoskeleton protein RodZ
MVAPAAKNSAAILEKPVQISPAAPTLPVESSLLLIGQSDAWVEVKNSTGQLVFNQLVKSGDRHLLKIEGTMNVVIGFADGVQVQLRGKPFDLTPFSKGAVARFEVK